MAGPLGLEWPRDRVAIVQKINEMRLEIRNRFPDASVFREAAYLVPVFRMTDISGDYLGFTLPPDMASLSSVWIDRDPTVLRSRWRERHTGFISDSHLEVQVIPTLNTSPIEVPLSSNGAQLQMRPTLPCDNGKTVEILADVKGVTHRLRFPLNAETWMTSTSIVSKIKSVVLPEDLKGPVTFRELGGRTLSVYPPTNPVPSFQRYKIATGCSPDYVIVMGPLAFNEVFADNDIVEIGDLAVLRHAASYLRYSDNTTEVGDLRRAKFDEELLRQHVNGVMARLEGQQTEDNPTPRPRRTRPNNRLNAYRKR